MHLFEGLRGRPRRGLFLLVLLAGLAAGSAAQDEPAGRVEEELEVLEVLVDVLVTGPEGHVIVGLGREDFLIEEDGRPVEVESVSFYSNRRLVARGAAVVDDSVPEDRHFVLLFARSPVGPQSDPRLVARLPRAGRSCVDWIARDLLPNDYVAVAVFDGGLNLVRDFTSDPERLETAVRQASSGKAPRKHWPTRVEARESGPSIASLMTDGGLRERTFDLAAAITELAAALGDVPGRKILVLLGAELPAPVSISERRGRDAMIEALNGSNVAVYALDVAGRGRRPGLERLTRVTGGRYPFHGRDLARALRDIERENSGFYLLSYKSAVAPGESGYRRIRVRTTNPELEARARSGYGLRQPG